MITNFVIEEVNIYSTQCLFGIKFPNVIMSSFWRFMGIQYTLFGPLHSNSLNVANIWKCVHVLVNHHKDLNFLTNWLCITLTFGFTMYLCIERTSFLGPFLTNWYHASLWQLAQHCICALKKVKLCGVLMRLFV